MAESAHTPNQPLQIPTKELPAPLRDLFKALNVTRSQCSLYGSEHPSTQEMVHGVVGQISDFVDSFGTSTLVFTKDAVIVRDTYYSSSQDSHALFQRLYARAIMAITFTGAPPAAQLTHFLTLINSDPSEIRAEEGPSAFLRKRGVTKIALTEALYESGDEEGEDGQDDAEVDVGSLDGAIVGVIKWLAKTDDNPELPRVPIAEILSQPDLAARLIQEAVTKLHAAGRTEPPSELAFQAIKEMKDLSAKDPGSWDKATPRIREAISKLPRELRPGVLGLGNGCAAGSSSDGTRPTVDIAEFDALVENLLMEEPRVPGTPNSLPALTELDGLFNATCTGLLPNWSTELMPANLAEASGRSYVMLMAWEANATEHGRMARRLADLARIEHEEGNLDAGLGLVGGLSEEACRVDALPGRASNALGALESLGLPVLRSLLEHAVKSTEARAHRIAALLVESLPELALNAVDLLEISTSTAFAESMQVGITKSSRDCIPTLRRLLETGTLLVREFALDALAALKSDWAAREIEEYLASASPDFIEMALPKMRAFPTPVTVRVCAGQLRHRRSEVRCAALRTLGVLRDESALPYLMDFALRRRFTFGRSDDQIEAIRGLGLMGTSDALAALQTISTRRALLFRSRQRRLREAALDAMEQYRSRPVEPQRKAA